MRKEYTVCDRCGTECDDHRFWIETDRQMDPAGSTDGVGEHVDLCYSCLFLAFHRWVLQKTPENHRIAAHTRNQEVLAWIKKGYPKR